MYAAKLVKPNTRLSLGYYYEKWYKVSEGSLMLEFLVLFGHVVILCVCVLGVM